MVVLTKNGRTSCSAGCMYAHVFKLGVAKSIHHARVLIKQETGGPRAQIHQKNIDFGGRTPRRGNDAGDDEAEDSVQKPRELPPRPAPPRPPPTAQGGGSSSRSLNSSPAKVRAGRLEEDPRAGLAKMLAPANARLAAKEQMPKASKVQTLPRTAQEALQPTT